ncbi:hypothetical protein DFJ77DRAFT_537866 [Powellomyces hirtus]|nr:hypothetical protein DFJ77DRAFT_537866 [Powellomyces hirtus]
MSRHNESREAALSGAHLTALLETLTGKHGDLFADNGLFSHSEVAAALFTDLASERLVQGLVQCDQIRDDLRAVGNEADERFADEYEAESRRLERLLEVMGVTKETLTRSGEGNLCLLADLAQELQIGDVHPTSYQVAMSDLILEELKANMELKKQTELLEEMEQRHHTIDAECRRTAAILKSVTDNEELDRQKEREWTRNAAMLTEKGDEYAERLQTLEERIDPALPTYTPATLLSLTETIDQLRTDLDSKELLLKGVADLPPDPVLANLKLAHRKIELTDLIQRKQEILSSIAQGIS